MPVKGRKLKREEEESVRDESGDWDGHIHTTTHKIGNYKDLLYSTGNSSQYSVMTYMGKESKKERIYVYV